MVPPVPGGVPAGPLLPPKTYAEYYNDLSRDPHQGNYVESMADFNVPLNGNSRYAPGPLLQRVTSAAATDTPLTFVTLCRSLNADPADPGHIRLFHRVSTYLPTVGSPATVWDNSSFALAGDLIDGQATIVPWVEANFNLSGNQVLVPSDATLDQLLAGNPNDQFVGPFNAGDQGVELIRSRVSMLVPFRYVNIFLPGPLTPRDAYLRVAGAIAAQHDEAACRPLLNFLKLALTRSAAQQPSPLARQHPVLAHAQDAQLVSHYMRLIRRDLPGLDTQPTTQAGQAIAAGLGQLVDQQRLMRQDAIDREQAKVNKTPTDLFGEAGLARLLRVCQVPTEVHLPAVYLELARAPKSNRRLTLQKAIDEAADAISHGRSFTVTPNLLLKVTGLTFAMIDPDQLDQGIQPFIVTRRTPTTEAQSDARAREYDAMMAGAGAPALSDVQTLTSPDSVGLPTRIEDTKQSLENFLVLSQVLYGAQHVLTRYIRQEYNDLIRNYAELDNKVLAGHHLLPAQLLRYIQVIANYWVTQQLRATHDVPLPTFTPIVQQSTMGSFGWVIAIPAAYLQLPSAPTWPPVSGPAPAPATCTSAANTGTTCHGPRNDGAQRQLRFESFPAFQGPRSPGPRPEAALGDHWSGASLPLQ